MSRARRALAANVPTRPCSGPSFAGNRAYLRMVVARRSPEGEDGRMVPDRPASTTWERIMNELPGQSLSIASPAAAGRRGRSLGWRSGL